MTITPPGLSIPEVRHDTARVNDTELHYVSAGETGSPVLLVHGFPETWWAFHGLIPLLAVRHRVVAVDLRGFGDSATAGPDDDAATAAEDLHALIEHLDLGPVHLTGQDISGMTTYRLAATHPQDVGSYTAIETALPGFGAEVLADPGRGGVWYIGALGTPGVADMFLRGRERAFIADHLLPMFGAVPPAVSDDDVEEFIRTYSRDGGLHGAAGQYGSMLRDGDELKAIAARGPFAMPVMTIGSAAGDGVQRGLRAATGRDDRSVRLPDVGHYAALQAPAQVAEPLLGFFDDVDSGEDAESVSALTGS